MTPARRILVLGPDEGWHAERFRRAAQRRGDALAFAPYESLAARIDERGHHEARCDAGPLAGFDAVLTRTMPAASLEQITLRLSVLHQAVAEGKRVVNGPATLEIAIDKYRTLARVAALGYTVPATRIVQTRREAMDAFAALGGDVVVKPLFGGEGRGVMRVADAELAWFTFATLERIQAVMYVQQFIPPGGIDTRLLVIGGDVFAVRRRAAQGWRTNVSQGARTERIEASDGQRQIALRVADDIGLDIGSVDLIDAEDGEAKVLEVNAVPGWKGAEEALGIDLAERMLAAI